MPITVAEQNQLAGILTTVMDNAIIQGKNIFSRVRFAATSRQFMKALVDLRSKSRLANDMRLDSERRVATTANAFNALQ